MAVMGRPKLENPRSSKVSLRVTDDYLEKIKEYATVHDMTIAQVIKLGLDLILEGEKK